MKVVCESELVSAVEEGLLVTPAPCVDVMENDVDVVEGADVGVDEVEVVEG